MVVQIWFFRSLRPDHQVKNRPRRVSAQGMEISALGVYRRKRYLQLDTGSIFPKVTMGEALVASTGFAGAGGHLLLSLNLHGAAGSRSSCQLTRAISSCGGRSALAFKSPQTVSTSRGRKYAHKANSSEDAATLCPGARQGGRVAMPQASLSMFGPQHQRLFWKPAISSRSRWRFASGACDRFSTVIQKRRSLSTRAMSRAKWPDTTTRPSLEDLACPRAACGAVIAKKKTAAASQNLVGARASTAPSWCGWRCDSTRHAHGNGICSSSEILNL